MFREEYEKWYAKVQKVSRKLFPSQLHSFTVINVEMQYFKPLSLTSSKHVLLIYSVQLLYIFHGCCVENMESVWEINHWLYGITRLDTIGVCWDCLSMTYCITISRTSYPDMTISIVFFSICVTFILWLH